MLPTALPHEVNILFNDLSYLYFNDYDAFQSLIKDGKLSSHICNIICKLMYILTGKNIDECQKKEYRPYIQRCLANHGGVAIFPFQDEKGEIILDWQPSIQENSLFINTDFFDHKRKKWNMMVDQGTEILRGNSEHKYNSTGDNTPCDLCYAKEKYEEKLDHKHNPRSSDLTIKLASEGELPEVRFIKNKLAKSWDKLPEGWTEESFKSFWGKITNYSKHPFTSCDKNMADVFPNDAARAAFCASGLDHFFKALGIKDPKGWRKKDWEGWDKYETAANKYKKKKKKAK